MFVSFFSDLMNLFSKLFEWKAVEVENQSVTDVIEDKRDYKKAVDIAEKIIDIAQNYKR